MSETQAATDTLLSLPKTVRVQTSQPKELYLLFFAELWERFGFYTIQTILILYMTKALAMTDQEANLSYAAFASLLYVTPVIGGYLADKYLGFQRAIIIGGLLFIMAYLICAFESKNLFFLGLSILICANGLFKPNVSAIVGELYEKNDPRRDSGFTLFYMGINIGALIPPLIAGGLVLKYGWHAGFLLAAGGMTIGQLIFQLGRKQLNTLGLYPKGQPDSIAQNPPSLKLYRLLAIGMLMIIGCCLIILNHPLMMNYIVSLSAIIVIGCLTFYTYKESVSDRKRIFAALFFTIIAAAFWALYNQTFTSLMLFADRNMNHHFLGFNLSTEMTQFFNPFFIMALSPLLSRFWLRLDRRQLNPSIQIKFFLGVLCMASGFLILALGANYFGENGMISTWWLVLSYLLQTTGELLISPIGLAMITVLCPKNLVGMMMGIWFFAQAASFAVGGFLANIAAVPETLDAMASLPVYAHAFTIYGIIAIGITIISFVCIPLLNYMIKE